METFIFTYKSEQKLLGLQFALLCIPQADDENVEQTPLFFCGDYLRVQSYLFEYRDLLKSYGATEDLLTKTFEKLEAQWFEVCYDHATSPIS